MNRSGDQVPTPPELPPEPRSPGGEPRSTRPEPPPRSEPPRSQNGTVAARPWYVVLFLCLTWISGALGALGGCSEVAYLRGSSDVRQQLGQPDQASPLLRPSVVRERARLEALGERHHTGFPLALAKLMVGGLLVVTSSLALAGKRGARRMALQAIAASAVMAAVDHWLTTPVREQVVQAVAVDTVDHGQGVLVGMGREESIVVYRNLHLWAEHGRLALLELGIFGGALFGLTRRRARDFFAAVESRVPDESPSDPF